jgi:hypothetical protein
MKLLDYIKSLMPTFTKNAIIKSCELSSESIKTHTLPAYVSATELFKGVKFKSKEILALQKEYEGSVPAGKNGKGIIGSITDGLENSLLILDALNHDSLVIYSDNEANISLTYLKTMVIKLIESIEFGNTYARRLLNYIYVMETKVENQDNDSMLLPAEVKWLEDNFLDFCLCMKVMKYDIKVIRKNLSDLPDASITELTERTFVTTVGVGKMDPFQFRHLSAKANLFYFFGMMIASNQAAMYKAAKAELELLQLRKLNLQKQYEKSPDAKIEKEISYMQNRVSGLNYDIEKMEVAYGID